MSNILIVDDDPIVLKIYRYGLERLGVQVMTAENGIAAMQVLRVIMPDLLVLDLMMPKFSGVDVLKFIRSEPALRDLPVVILSNCYMNELAAEAAKLGVQKTLLKVGCTPSILLQTTNEVIAGKISRDDTSSLPVAPGQSPPSPAPAAPSDKPVQVVPVPTLAAIRLAGVEFKDNTREEFLRDAVATCTSLRDLYQAFTSAPNPTEREERLQAFYRKVRSVAGIAGLVNCHPLAQMATAFEALLFEISQRPTAASPSVLRTIASTVDFLALLFDRARDSDPGAPLAAQALVVDDDAVNNRLVVSALRRAQLHARSTEDPMQALRWLQERQFDLVLLDITMPGMTGFELCQRLRALPGYTKTPVIYVTVHNDFESLAKSVLSGGDDLIPKPFFPMDLVVKVVTLLLKRQLALP